VLANPKKEGHYITIELVKQNVLPFEMEEAERAVASQSLD